VLLYDQDGEPLDAGSDLYDAEGRPLDTKFPVDGDGVEVRNAYPLDQRALTWGRQRAGARRRRAAPAHRRTARARARARGLNCVAPAMISARRRRL
jgi:hypothetical protein